MFTLYNDIQFIFHFTSDFQTCMLRHINWSGFCQWTPTCCKDYCSIFWGETPSPHRTLVVLHERVLYSKTYPTLFYCCIWKLLLVRKVTFGEVLFWLLSSSGLSPQIGICIPNFEKRNFHSCLVILCYWPRLLPSCAIDPQPPPLAC